MNKENESIVQYTDIEKHFKSVSDSPGDKENNLINETPITANRRPVKDVIPESRLARFYGNFYYDEERESCFSADISVNSSYVSKLPLITEDDNDIGFWMLPEDLKLGEEESSLPGLTGSTTKQGRTIRELLLQLDSIYPELVLPHHLSNVAINIPFSFFACGNIEKQASDEDSSSPMIANALYTPALKSDEEKSLYEKVYGKDVKDCWKQRSCQLLNQEGKIQSFIRTPIFPLTPELTSALERALQNFKIQMKNIYSTSDPFNKQKRTSPILSQSRKIIQSRHTHKPPRIQSAFKSNLLIKNINGRFVSLCIPGTSTATRPKITADNPTTINCCRQNQTTINVDKTLPQKECNRNNKQKNQNALNSFPMIPATISGMLVNKFQQQKTIPVYQKPPETYAGRLSKNALSSSSNCVKHPTINYGNSQNNNLILLTNSKKNKLKYSAKTRSLENIKISSQSHQSVEIFQTPQNAYENNSKENVQDFPVYSEQSNSFKGVQGHHSKLTASSSFGSNNTLSCKKREPLSNERNRNTKVNSRVFANESNSLNSEKKNNYTSGYPRRKKKDSRDEYIETNRMKKPIILLRKNPTSPMKVSANPNKDVCSFKKSPELSSKSETSNLSPQKGKSPIASLDCSTILFNEADTTPQSESSPKPKCCSSLVDNEISKLKSESNKDFDLLGNIPGESTLDKSNSFSGTGKKVSQGPTVAEIAPNPNPSGRRLYSAVLSSSPHHHITTATSMSCDTFTLTPIYTANASDYSLMDKKSNRDLQLKSVYSVVSNQSLCSSEETVSWTDAHLDKLEREALEQYKVSDESLNEKLEELERQAIEQYSGSSNSNTSCGVCNSQPKLKNKESNEKPKCCKSTNHIPKTIDSVVIYSKSASTSNTNVEISGTTNKKSKNFKNVGMNKANNKQKKKNSKFSL